MLEYDDYMRWIDSFETKHLLVGDEFFKTADSVKSKVNNRNKFRSFFGDTIVFNLDYKTKSIVSGLISTLYSVIPECFCERIQSSTIHMTLHDLSSSSDWDSVKGDVFENKQKIRELLNASPILPQTIQMRTNNISNSVQVSLVLSLAPVDKYEYEKLMKIYEFFDQVRDLKRPLIPHITLGYYNQYGFDSRKVAELKKLVRELNNNTFEITLNTEDLVYQAFASMNNYKTILKLIEL